jgi:hypothetical protein
MEKHELMRMRLKQPPSIRRPTTINHQALGSKKSPGSCHFIPSTATAPSLDYREYIYTIFEMFPCWPKVVIPPAASL